MSLHRQLHVAADTIAGTLPCLWRPEWSRVHTSELPRLLADVYEPYSALAVAVSKWWAEPSRDGWDIPVHHPEEISAACGWDVTDSLGYADPLLPVSQCCYWIDQLAERLRWWRLRPHGEAIMHEIEHGRPPGRGALERLLDLVDDGQADGRAFGGNPSPDSGPGSEGPATLSDLGLSRQRLAEARGEA